MNIRKLLLLSTMLMATPSLAQEPAAPAATAARPDEIKAQSPLAAREQALAPVLSWMQAIGVKLTYLGDEGGLSGYLAEDATGKMQTIYVTPDREHVIAGLLLKRGGDNITGVQVGEMRERFAKAAEQYVPKEATDTRPSTTEPSTPAAKKEVGEAEPADPEPATATQPAPSEPAPAETAPSPAPAAAVPADVPSEEKAGVDAQQQSAITPALALPVATGPAEGAGGNPSEIWSSPIEKERFLKAVADVPYFEVGSMNAPITLYEIADPQCPYCHAAWDYIKPLVFEKKIKVRVILIAALNGSEPKAREILASGLPARRWIESDAGKNLKLEMDPESQPFKDSMSFLDKNMDFARQFGVDRTPFLGYVGFDGKFYSALGLPSDLKSFLSAGLAR
ncbi:thioredoxin fold domain-containing protein [Agrobacterium rubi]|nr:thioredoxin fold domain-containing protein [Agrobacterium rubi]NTF24255.1 thioredoxin fold domain-containing protein [Agrobacterium rubi]